LGSGNAGNLDITAREIRLDRQGKLLANTTSGNGGNINLQLQNLLLLRNMSQISATAGTEVAGGGNGGNITINTPNGFIVAVPNENSDISANAFTGSGGKVEITAYGVFGIEPRSREDLEKLLGTNDPTKLDPQKLPTNDITAISQANPTLNGVVKINTPDIDPNEGLINLPTQPVELKVAQVCKAGAGRNQNSFTVTGRGGVPSSPTEPLSADAVLADWITLDKVSATPSNTPVTQNYTKPNPETIVEATGWEINAKGEIVLTATVPNVTHHNSWQKSADCSALPASS
jgi:large exoprotein involved in heme utilization and adhesion